MVKELIRLKDLESEYSKEELYDLRKRLKKNWEWGKAYAPQVDLRPFETGRDMLAALLDGKGVDGREWKRMVGMVDIAEGLLQQINRNKFGKGEPEKRDH